MNKPSLFSFRLLPVSQDVTYHAQQSSYSAEQLIANIEQSVSIAESGSLMALRVPNQTKIA